MKKAPTMHLVLQACWATDTNPHWMFLGKYYLITDCIQRAYELEKKNWKFKRNWIYRIANLHNKQIFSINKDNLK
jgi:hypothetical protein